MSNGSLTLAINSIWRSHRNGDDFTLAAILYELAQNEDCDMHNIDDEILWVCKKAESKKMDSGEKI